MRYGRHGDDGEDDFDDYGRGRDLDGDSDRDHDRDHDRDRDSDRDGGGSGSERDDEGEGTLMTMTRRDSERDVRDLYNTSLDDMRRFLRERESAEDPMKSVTSNAVIGLEIGVGAIIAGFLAQRFRQAGAVVPVGVTLAALGLAAAQFNKVGKFSPDLRYISFGALASALSLWAAGRGAISAEGASFGPPSTAGMLPGTAAPAPMFASSFQPQPMMQPMMQSVMQQPMQRPMAPAPMFASPRASTVSPPTVGVRDFHNLVAQGGGVR